jgi:HSP20 family protein
MMNTLTTRDYFDVLSDRFFDRAARDLANYDVTYGSLRTIWDENENEYIVRAEVPGLNEDNIDLSYENGILGLTIEYKEEDEHALRQGKFQKSWRIPDIEPDNIHASMNNGILSITFPKSEKAKPKKISINK